MCRKYRFRLSVSLLSGIFLLFLFGLRHHCPTPHAELKLRHERFQV
ncbi:hypothetical protein KJZ61_00135 [Candidatus Dependentiae bacterium]|nr:hypothetical protein [Candidatus Dependentiae bacterium]